MPIEEFHYQIPWRATGVHPGYHRGKLSDGGFEFRDFTPLLYKPDPRRVDIRASIRDPFEQIVVRIYSQRTAIPVYALADLSASMGYIGSTQKLEMLADFVASIGYSAYRTGDPFGFIGCDSELQHDFLQPLTRRKIIAAELALRLRNFTPQGENANGLLQAPSMMGKQKGLVFILSDFYFPVDLLERLLAALSHHTIVPVVLTGSSESISIPRFGIVRIRDSETGAQRTLMLRPSFRNRIRERFKQQRKALTKLCLTYGIRPLYVTDQFEAQKVTQYFYE